MYAIRIALLLCLVAPAATVITTSSAAAQVYCRTYVWRMGHRTCWRRVCWRVPEQRYAYRPAPPQYTYQVPSGARAYRRLDNAQIDHSQHDASAAKFKAATSVTSSDDRLQRAFAQAGSGLIAGTLIILLIFIPLRLLAHFAVWLVVHMKRRREERIERRAHSARELALQLERDAAEADRLIEKFKRAAYGRGALSVRS